MMASKNIQNEGQAVISMISPVSAIHWRDYVIDHWGKLTEGITDGFKMLVLAGVHGGKGGEIGKVSDNIEDIKGQVVSVVLG